MRYGRTILCLTAIMAIAPAAFADEHYDIAPYFQDGRLLTGGLDHAGNATAPSISVYGYEFGEEALDPYNLSDPGVNQAAGTGNLPSGATVSYNIVSNLKYWDGAGEVSFVDPGETYITLLVGNTSNLRTITGTSGEQAGSLIQTVTDTGSLHKHFTTSLYAYSGTNNIPGEDGYVAPDEGVYAFSIELTMTYGGTTYTSDPVWIVLNNGMSEDVHEAAMESLASVPEPASMFLLATGAITLLRKRRNKTSR